METEQKIHTFIWKVLHNGLAVYGNLTKFNTHISNICSLCNSEEETVQHLLFSCQFSKAVFQASPLHIDIPMDTSSMDIIQFWLSQTDQNANKWQAPPPYHIKINVDAAYLDGKGAATAVAIDSSGRHLGSEAFCFDSFSSMVA
ncbi:uncharacterized protein LOC113326519 [Papaver somniferum]|uniref:uncharacterized protein LOC113326519 n=1 Tax=Papaver somniferum TaxID=3469 RepID=UPI000E7024E4|nr:uncharacterized protein LOC113326519 [Papaver somniferum]